MNLPTHKTIALRVLWDPSAINSPPHRWPWCDLTDCFVPERDVHVTDQLHLLTLCHQPSGCVELVKVFSSTELATAYLEQWANRRLEEEYCGPDEAIPEHFDDFVSASRFVEARFGIIAGLRPITIDPEFSEE